MKLATECVLSACACLRAEVRQAVNSHVKRPGTKIKGFGGGLRERGGRYHLSRRLKENG